MEEREELTIEEQIKDLYQRTEDLLTGLEKVSDILSLYGDALRAHGKAIDSLLPVKDRDKI
jgi:hypothetical protein